MVKKPIGLIVPSSNVTMETEIPAMLRRWQTMHPGVEMTFHSSRMRMLHVTPDELKSMDRESDRCAVELSDSDCDVLAYACLVAIMAQGGQYYRDSEARLMSVAKDNGHPAPVVSSAGALVRGLKRMGAKRVSLVAPYLPEVTDLVVASLEDNGIEVLDALSLSVADNLKVACLDTENLAQVAMGLNRDGADAVVLSACVQMPSLSVVPRVEDNIGMPVVTAAIATTYEILEAMGLETFVKDAGYLLSGKVAP